MDNVRLSAIFSGRRRRSTASQRRLRHGDGGLKKEDRNKPGQDVKICSPLPTLEIPSYSAEGHGCDPASSDCDSHPVIHPQDGLKSSRAASVKTLTLISSADLKKQQEISVIDPSQCQLETGSLGSTISSTTGDKSDHGFSAPAKASGWLQRLSSTLRYHRRPRILSKPGHRKNHQSGGLHRFTSSRTLVNTQGEVAAFAAAKSQNDLLESVHNLRIAKVNIWGDSESGTGIDLPDRKEESKDVWILRKGKLCLHNNTIYVLMLFVRSHGSFARRISGSYSSTA